MYKVDVNEKYKFDLDLNEADKTAVLNGETVAYDVLQEGKSFHAIVNNKSYNVHLLEKNALTKELKLSVNGNVYTVDIKDKLDLLLEKLGMDTSMSAAVKDMKAPMPGLVVELKAAPGDVLKKGDPILVLEAMKMENVLKAPADVEIDAFKVEKGDTIEKNAVLVTFK